MARRNFKFQLAILLIGRVVEPISFTVLFPFVNSMVEDLLPDVPKSAVGRYSGMLESLFSLASFLCMYQWGKLSDRKGRRPVMLWGLLANSFSLILFGLSQSIWWAMGARVLSGALCGNASVLRAALGEISSPENEGWVYPLWSICWDLSILIGPLIGAALSNPAKQHPDSWLGQSALFRKFPYLAPCLFCACLTWTSFVVAALFFEETLDKAKKPPAGEADERTALLPPTTASDTEDRKTEPAAQMSILKLVRIPAVKHVLISLFFICFIALSFDAGFILFCYSSLSLGGLGLSPGSIAACLSLRGISSIIFSLFLFPLAQRRLGTQPLYRFFVACWIPLFLVLPLMNRLVSGDRGYWVANGEMRHLWAVMVPTMLVYTLGDLSFPLNMLALNASAPDPACLGALNGIALSVGSLARNMGPASIGWLYSLSAESRFPFVWVAYIALSVVGTIQAFWVRGRAQQEQGGVKVQDQAGTGPRAGGDEERIGTGDRGPVEGE